MIGERVFYPNYNNIILSRRIQSNYETIQI
jgi:hypothetical protein